MATTTAQRAGIWIIAAVLIVGTLAGFLAMVLAPKNEAATAAQQQEEYKKMMKQYCEEQQKANEPLTGYEAKAFNGDNVDALQVKVLKQGSGETLKDDSKISANYFGWTSDGKIFDSSRKSGTTSPIEFGLDGVITGWTEGLTGQKVGSVVKLTIPADKAYGSTSDGTSCSPVGPLTFIVEVKKLVKSDE